MSTLLRIANPRFRQCSMFIVKIYSHLKPEPSSTGVTANESMAEQALACRQVIWCRSSADRLHVAVTSLSAVLESTKMPQHLYSMDLKSISFFSRECMRKHPKAMPHQQPCSCSTTVKGNEENGDFAAPFLGSGSTVKMLRRRRGRRGFGSKLFCHSPGSLKMLEFTEQTKTRLMNRKFF